MENFGELHIEDKEDVDEAYHLLVVEREGENKARGVHYDCTLNKISEKEYEDRNGNIYEEASSATFTHTAGSVYKYRLDDVHEDDDQKDKVRLWKYSPTTDGKICKEYIGPEELWQIEVGEEAFKQNDPDFKGFVTSTGLKRVVEAAGVDLSQDQVGRANRA